MSRQKPLDGITVLDMTRLLPGALCTQHLADMGATVIKIEDTGPGDYARDWHRGGRAMSPMFHVVNRNKRSLAVDLRAPEGRDLFLRLAKGADVVVEGFRPGVVDRLGVGFAAVRAVNPAIIYCSITGFGQNGPWRDRAGHDINFLSLTGILDQTGPVGGPPAQTNFQIGDLIGGTLGAAVGILAALVDRLRTGKGRHVDVSMTDCALAHSAIALASLQTHGRQLPRGTDMLNVGLPCYTVYETADGRHMALGPLEEKFWDAMCDAVDRPDLKTPHWTEGAAADIQRAELEKTFKSRTMAEWTEVFDRIDCCVTPVLTLEEAAAHEHFKARGMFVEVTDPDDGPITQFAQPIRFSDDPGTIGPDQSPAPRQGQHTAEILANLGLDQAEITDLTTRKVVR